MRLLNAKNFRRNSIQNFHESIKSPQKMNDSLIDNILVTIEVFVPSVRTRKKTFNVFKEALEEIFQNLNENVINMTFIKYSIIRH
jgi:hypothetical protein